MVVQHNMQAMNANRMLNITTGAQSKSTEKLSSGYRINRAGDDAVGVDVKIPGDGKAVFLQTGAADRMAAQFFRARLLEKKQQVNRLHSGREGK